MSSVAVSTLLAKLGGGPHFPLGGFALPGWVTSGSSLLRLGVEPFPPACAVVTRRYAEPFADAARKVIGGLKAALIGDLTDPQPGMGQQKRTLPGADTPQIVQRVFPIGRLEQLVEVLR